MPIIVIDIFKAVDIDKKYRKSMFVAPAAFKRGIGIG